MIFCWGCIYNFVLCPGGSGRVVGGGVNGRLKKENCFTRIVVGIADGWNSYVRVLRCKFFQK